MIEYIERERAREEILRRRDECRGKPREKAYNTGIDMAACALNWVPTADVTTVVRCEKCCEAVHKEDEKFVWCKYWGKPMLKTGFCSLGEESEGQ